jgi:hypothetical protein
MRPDEHPDTAAASGAPEPASDARKPAFVEPVLALAGDLRDVTGGFGFSCNPNDPSCNPFNRLP